jgi:hypothetical protein
MTMSPSRPKANTMGCRGAAASRAGTGEEARPPMMRVNSNVGCCGGTEPVGRLATQRKASISGYLYALSRTGELLTVSGGNAVPVPLQFALW